MLELSGLLLGLLAGMLCPWTVPAKWSLYLAAGLLAALDSALGGLNARLKENFSLKIYLSGALGNAGIAVCLTWLGEKLGIPLYLAAVVVFGTRMFQNFAEIRRELLTSTQKKDKIKQDVVFKLSRDTKSGEK
ncbi:MAG: small basic family protein [Oscillospiraceae bacterium]|nr:small basic family protein [Oscillospiraceae bacterium]